MAKEFVSPQIEMYIEWGPVASQSFVGDLKSGVGVVFLTCSPKPVVMPIACGKCVVPKTNFPVDDCGRVTAAMVLKIGMQGNSPNPVSNEIVSASVHATAKPVTFLSTIVVPLTDLCVDNKMIECTGHSLEIPDIIFKVKMKTRYIPTPEQLNLVKSLNTENRIALTAISEHLEAASKQRIEKIMGFIEARAGKENADECKRGFVSCPEQSWNSMGAMDSAQMTELGLQYTKVLRDRYTIPLVAAAQQTLCSLMQEGRPCDLLEVSSNVCATKEGRTKVQSLIQRHVEEWVACNSCYTYDAGLDSFSMSSNLEEIQSLLSKLAHGTLGVGGRVGLRRRRRLNPTRTHRCNCHACIGQVNTGLSLDGIVNKSGESQDLAGLINVGTMYMRNKTMSTYKQQLALNKANIPPERVQAALREANRVQNANLILGDCEDMAFAMTAVMQAPKMYDSQEEFDVDVDKTLKSILASDPASHAAIKKVLEGYRTACLEASPHEFVSTSLVFARGANLADQALTITSDETPKTLNAIKTDFECSQKNGMAGHAVCTNFSIKDPVTVDGVCVAEIINWQTREGTADTLLLPRSSLEKMHLSFVCKEPAIQAFSGKDVNSCAGHNIMGQYFAHTALDTCQAKFPNSKLLFNPQQVCDPIDHRSSFYRYSIAFGSFYTVTHENGVRGLLDSTQNHIGLLQNDSSDKKRGNMMSCASMVLGQQRQQCNSTLPMSLPIGISVPISNQEREYLHMVAFCHRALYVTHDDLLNSAKETGFYLMPTRVAGHGVDGVKCNSFVAVTNGDMATELNARSQVARAVGADAVRHLNSHTFSLTWKV